MKVVFDEFFFDEIDHFHPNFDESVPDQNPILQSKTVCTGPGHGRCFPKPSDQVPTRSGATTVTRIVGVHVGPTCQIGQNSFSGEFEECTTHMCVTKCVSMCVTKTVFIGILV